MVPAATRLDATGRLECEQEFRFDVCARRVQGDTARCSLASAQRTTLSFSGRTCHYAMPLRKAPAGLSCKRWVTGSKRHRSWRKLPINKISGSFYRKFEVPVLWIQCHLSNWRNFTPAMGKRQTQPHQIAVGSCSPFPKQSGSVQKCCPRGRHSILPRIPGQAAEHCAQAGARARALPRPPSAVRCSLRLGKRGEFCAVDVLAYPGALGICRRSKLVL